MDNVKKRDYWPLDLLKYVLAILVIMRHCGQSYWDSDTLFVKVITCIISPLAVPSFFAISGFLLFREKVAVTRFKRQVFRILKLYLIWSLIYLPISTLSVTIHHQLFSVWFFGYIQNMLFNGTCYHLWFLPSLAVAVFLAYLLDMRIKNSLVLFFLGLILYIIGTLVDTYPFFPPYTDWTLYKSIFLTTRNGLFFGFVFVIIGKIIAEKQTTIRSIKAKTLLLIAIIGLIILAIEGWFLCWANAYSVVNMTFAAVILVPVILIVTIKKSSEIYFDNGKDLRNMSTLLFCCHPWVMSVITVVTKKVPLSSIEYSLLALVFSVIVSYTCLKMAKKYSIIYNLM